MMVFVDKNPKMSGLVINIKAGATVGESSVNATGTVVNVIADSERASFGIGSDADLKQAIGKYLGKVPDNAYLHSPTPPWGDLYKKHGWNQVQRVLQPIKAQILGIKTKPTILSTNTLTNESNKTAMYTTKISEQVTDTVSIEWSNSSKLSVGLMISYGFKFLGTGIEGEVSFGFEQTWGNGRTETKQMTAGMETGVTVELKPRESVIAELSASSGKMHVRITYEAHLIGRTIAYYNNGHKGFHTWAPDIGAVLGGSNKVQVVEDIEVGYYSNATVKLRNAKTNEDMMFYMADLPTESTSADYPDEPPSE